MSRRPKSVREIYLDSISVNLETLTRQLIERGATKTEIDAITSFISKSYDFEVEKIAQETELNMMAIENSPSPLELFVNCVSKLIHEQDSLPPLVNSLLKQYVKTMHDWM